MGKVAEFYFDDQAWIIVYLVVSTGNGLSGRKVLISPYALTKSGDRPGIFPVDLTIEQIKSSPNIDTDLPVSRRLEMTLHGYFHWQRYWSTDFYSSGIWGIVAPPFVDAAPLGPPDGDPHLRSTHAITGYHIETIDGELGHLRDFIIDDETWHIEFLVVEMYSWLERKRVLIARKHIKEIQCATSKVLVDVTSYTLEKSMPYNAAALCPADSAISGLNP